MRRALEGDRELITGMSTAECLHARGGNPAIRLSKPGRKCNRTVEWEFVSKEEICRLKATGTDFEEQTVLS